MIHGTGCQVAENGDIERCNGSIRRKLLNAYIFRNIGKAREKSEEYLQDYNEERPHKTLGYFPPVEFVKYPDPIKLKIN